MRAHAFIVPLLLTLGATAVAQPTDMLQALLDDVGTDAQPGCVIGVMQDGKLIQSAARGVVEIGAPERLSTRTRFNIASVSKQFTALAILLLEQDGRLRLDDSIRTHVPELGAYAQPVTLRHLLHHTGGLREYVDLLLLAGRDFEMATTQADALAALAAQRGPNAAANMAYAYSNTGYFLLGLVVERRSGTSLAQFAHARIFEPLAMNDTVIVDRYPAGLSRFARGYSRDANGFVLDESPWQQTGDGQVHSTIEDLARWENNFLTAQVGGRAGVAKLVQTGTLSDGRPIDYALGLRVATYRGLTTVGHGGDWMGYVAHFRRYPEQRFASAVLCNRADVEPARLTERLADHYLSKHMSGPAVPKQRIAKEPEGSVHDEQWTMPALACFTGRFNSAETPAVMSITAEDGRLMLAVYDRKLALKPAGNDEVVGSGLLYEGAPFTLKFNSKGRRAFELYTSELRGLAFDGDGTPCKR